MKANLKIKSLQGLRGIACVFVFLSHSYGNFQIQNAYISSLFADLGRLGVLCFFVLSGILEGKKSRTTKPILKEAISFVLYKIKKIYLCYIIALIAMLLLTFKSFMLVECTGGGMTKLIIKILLHILMLQSYVPKLGVAYSFNGPAWFLSACLLIWFLTPYLQYFLSKVKQKRSFIILECITFLMQFVYLIGIYALRLEEQRYFMYVFPLVNLLIYFEAMVFEFITKNSIPLEERKSKLLYIGSLILLCVMYLAKNTIPVDFRIYFWQMPVIVLIYILSMWEEKKYIGIF